MGKQLEMFKGDSTSKYVYPQRRLMADSWNKEGKELNCLYWIRNKFFHTDPYTEGYIGAGTLQRPKASLQECINEGLGSAEELECIVLATGSGTDMNLLELVYRRNHGIGWNYTNGGGRGHGGGTSSYEKRKAKLEQLKDKEDYADFPRG